VFCITEGIVNHPPERRNMDELKPSEHETVEHAAAEPAAKPWWTPIIHFAAHTVVGTTIFVIIGLPAVGLSIGIQWLERLGVPPFPLAVLDFVEEALCVIDAGLFLLYVILTSYHALKEFWK
jgi:hypothetical protein